MELTNLENSIFTITSEEVFNTLALRSYQHQYANNTVYRRFCDLLGKTPSTTHTVGHIPFLPISFFKTKKVLATPKTPQMVFRSSGTTGQEPSKHYVANVQVYQKSFMHAFAHFYGKPQEYCILALLPSYLERGGSSLVYMVDALMKRSAHAENGYFLYDFDALREQLLKLEYQGQKTLLIGVSFALLDFAKSHALPLQHTLVMETGGMKGRKKELTRQQLHSTIKEAFSIGTVHSEYGMTELLSQAYSKGNGIFTCPPWMRVVARNPEDPLSNQKMGKTGGINIIDLANLHSCSFIATQDLGRTFDNGNFQVLGRFDHAEARGCNLMAL